jgi:hypothetical protein
LVKDPWAATVSVGNVARLAWHSSTVLAGAAVAPRAANASSAAYDGQTDRVQGLPLSFPGRGRRVDCVRSKLALARLTPGGRPPVGREFWTAFRVLGDWYAEPPPY